MWAEGSNASRSWRRGLDGVWRSPPFVGPSRSRRSPEQVDLCVQPDSWRPESSRLSSILSMFLNAQPGLGVRNNFELLATRPDVRLSSLPPPRISSARSRWPQPAC